ncbi:GNAT family N-acetyltransferase [Legionella dresdenensis]|uniref:Bifunctional AAC/APH n=1 Tax=Legionella dresdenensis TaxID=450200 RepID=A0ABV8CG92_9GAMM
MTLSFEKMGLQHIEIIFDWLAESFVQEFWDNTQGHKDDILNFVNGRKEPSNYCDGMYVYWVASCNGHPFAMLMTIQETAEDHIDDIKLNYLSKTGHTYGIDFMIGNKNYFGKGYGAKTLSEFLDFFRKEFDVSADTFLIDPASDNPRAKNVYMKAGFKHVADFIMSGDVSGAGKLHHLLIRRFEPAESDDKPFNITIDLARQLIAEQFPEFAHLPIEPVEKQGHDNRTYRLGREMLIRMPTAESYALKVPKEQSLLPKLAPRLTVSIPAPIKMGAASGRYPYPFSIYKWLEGVSINLLMLDNECIEKLAFDLARFLKELQNITDVSGPVPGQHNWWRGDHVSVYDKGARDQISELSTIIDGNNAIKLWERACKTKWSKSPVWIHGDFAIGNMLLNEGKLSAIIDFGGMALGDPACDLVIAWTFLNGKARDIFFREMGLDENTWLRAKAWALWKATFELCQITDKNSPEALIQKRIIEDVVDE